MILNFEKIGVFSLTVHKCLFTVVFKAASAAHGPVVNVLGRDSNRDRVIQSPRNGSKEPLNHVKSLEFIFKIFSCKLAARARTEARVGFGF